MIQLAFAALLIAPTLHAERYALLVGVSRPASGGDYLAGPVNDVEALRQRLTRLSFAKQNIYSLTDEAATREAILDTLRRMVAKGKSGDLVIFYFSGHGTSSFDGEFGSDLAPGTGALIPYDVGSRPPISQTLIIGDRDIRPILSTLHSEATGLVILDSCYSEDASKSSEQSPPARYWQPKARKSGWQRMEEFARLHFRKGTESYPYKNILSLAASARFQPAFDISPEQIRAGNFRTVDDRPHGAMSNALLAGLDGSADTDRDGILTYGELFRFVQETVSAEFHQQPQYQYPANSRNMLDQQLFRFALASTLSSRVNVQPLLLELVGVPPEVTKALQGVSGVRTAVSRADYSLRSEASGGFTLSQYPSNTEITRFSGNEIDKLLEALRAIVASKELIAFHFSKPHGDASLEVEPANQAWYADGQRFSISGSVTESGFALLLSIDATGIISVLHPVDETVPFPAGKVVPLLRARSTAPFGVTTLKLLVFAEEPLDIDSYICKSSPTGTRCPEFSASSEAFRKWMRLLNTYSGRGSDFHLKVNTRP